MRLKENTKNWFASRRLARRWKDDLNTVERYCLFIGHPRSSHSLIGSLLDAHPNMIFAHEQDILRYVRLPFSGKQLLALTINNSKIFTAKGRQWTGYSYRVSNQYQGRSSDLRVVGDKKGANTNRRLLRSPGLAKKLEKKLQLPLFWFRVVRNPWDNIATMAARKSKASYEEVDEKMLRKAIKEYKKLHNNAVQFLNKQPAEQVYVIHIPDFMTNPKTHLKMLCEFLKVEADEAYLEDCASIVFAKPHSSASKVNWPSSVKNELKEWMSQDTELARYADQLS